MTKTNAEKLKELAVTATSVTQKGLSSVQQAIGDAVEHDNTQAVVAKVKGLAESATQGAKNLTGRVVDTVKAADINHKDVAEKVETVSMGLGITSGAVAVGAALAAPTGLGAVGVALGVTSAPLIVTAAPIIGAAATAAGVVSGGAYFYSKWKAKQTDEDGSDKP